MNLSIIPISFEFVKWEMIFQGLATLIILWFLYKKLFPNFQNYLEKRKDYINQKIQKTEEDSKEAEKLKAEKEQDLQNLKQSHKEILENYKKEATVKADELVGNAKAKVSYLLEKNTKELEQEKQEAESKISTELLDLSTVIAEKFLKEKVSEKQDMNLIEEAIKEVEKSYE